MLDVILSDCRFAIKRAKKFYCNIINILLFSSAVSRVFGENA